MRLALHGVCVVGGGRAREGNSLALSLLNEVAKVAQEQRELELPQPPEAAEESEQDREARLHLVLLRHMDEAVREVGTKNVCYALGLAEELLSKQLRCVENKRPGYKLLAYLVKHQQSGRLATWLMRDYAGYLVPQRPEKLEADDALRQVLALALAGEFGNAGREKVAALYARTKRRGEP